MGLGSGIRKKPISDPGSRRQKGPGSGSATLQGGQTLEQCPQLQPHHMFWLLLRSSELYSKVRPLYRFKKNQKKPRHVFFHEKNGQNLQKIFTVNPPPFLKLTFLHLNSAACMVLHE